MKVEELVEKLQQFDQELEVVIDDADTGWWLDIRDVDQPTTDRVLIGGNYSFVDKD